MKVEEYRKLAHELLVLPYGEKHYSREQLNLLWEAVKLIGANEFRRACNELAMVVSRPPSVAQIRGQCLPAIQRAESDRRDLERKRLANCFQCGGTGWVFALLRDDPSFDFAFICDKCEAPGVIGIGNSRGARYWSQEHEDHYQLLPCGRANKAPRVESVGFRVLRMGGRDGNTK